MGSENLDSKASRSNLASCFLDYKTPNDIGVLTQGWEKRNSHLETGKQEQVNQAAFLILDADDSLHIWQPEISKNLDNEPGVYTR